MSRVYCTDIEISMPSPFVLWKNFHRNSLPSCPSATQTLSSPCECISHQRLAVSTSRPGSPKAGNIRLRHFYPTLIRVETFAASNTSNLTQIRRSHASLCLPFQSTPLVPTFIYPHHHYPNLSTPPFPPTAMPSARCHSRLCMAHQPVLWTSLLRPCLSRFVD